MEQKTRGRSKEIALELLMILEEYTDRDHRLSKNDIIDRHSWQYGNDGEEAIQAKTFYAKIDELTSAGFPVKRTKGKWTKYYLDDVRLSKEELLFLVCMIKSSPVLGKEESTELAGKLLSMRVHKQAANNIAKNVSVVEEHHNLVSRQIHNFAVLVEAINKASKVSCKYVLSREGGYRFSETRIVCPRAIEFTRDGACVTLEDNGIIKRMLLCDIINIEPE